MKTNHIIILTLAMGVSTCLLTAQDGAPRRDGQRPPQREGGPGGFGGQRPINPFMEALDLNKDGAIDAEEIAKASASLKKLDKNGDGKITQDEFRPQRPGGLGGPGGQGGPGGEGRGPDGVGRRPGGPGGQPGGQGDRPQRPKSE